MKIASDEIMLSQDKAVTKAQTIEELFKDYEDDGTREPIIEIDDHYLLALAEERLKNDNEALHSFDEVLAKDGLTLLDIETMEDVEYDIAFNRIESKP